MRKLVINLRTQKFVPVSKGQKCEIIIPHFPQHFFVVYITHLLKHMSLFECENMFERDEKM